MKNRRDTGYYLLIKHGPAFSRYFPLKSPGCIQLYRICRIDFYKCNQATRICKTDRCKCNQATRICKTDLCKCNQASRICKTEQFKCIRYFLTTFQTEGQTFALYVFFQSQQRQFSVFRNLSNKTKPNVSGFRNYFFHT